MKRSFTSRKVEQFKKLATRLQKMVNSGQFKELSRKKQGMLVARFQRVSKQVQNLLPTAKFQKLATAFAVTGALATATPAVAQVQFGAPQSPMFNIDFNNSTTIGEPKPALVDIDGDGDLDMFLAGRDGEIHYYENTGDATNPAFGNPVPDPFGMSYVGVLAQMAFGDMDGDGDMDALIGELYGDLYYFQNTGTAAAPAFATPVANPFSITATGSYAAKPAIADMDGDGDLDILIGTLYGDVLYYQNTGTASSPQFGASQVNPFGISAAYYYASPSLTDMDNDGDFDLFLGLVVSLYGGEMRYYENIGTATAPDFGTYLLSANLNSYISYNGLTTGDLDNDGDLDIIHGDGDGYSYTASVSFIENTGTAASPTFGTPVPSPFGMNFGDNIILNPQIAVADMDSDGDMDFMLGDFLGELRYYKNTGGNTFAAAQTSPFGLQPTGLINISPRLVDIDDDGDMDLFYGDAYGSITYHENIGTAASPMFGLAVTNPIGLTPAPYYAASIVFADMDNDGDMDAMVGSGDGTNPVVKYRENTGTSTAPQFAAPVTNVITVPVGSIYFASVAVADVDRDGDFDVLLGGDYYGTHYYYENTGTPTAPTFGTPVTDPFGLYSVSSFNFPVLADMDGDTDIDLILTTNGGDSYYFENTAFGVNTNQVAVADAFKVFPNPAKDFVTVQMDEVAGETVIIEVVNSMGQVVYQDQVAAMGSINETLATKSLEAGLYILRLSTNEEVFTKTFVKQ